MMAVRPASLPLVDRSAEHTLDTLLEAVQALSLARELADVQRVVRTAARRLVAADGATFVLRDDGHCFYADEDAISPLWKGQRFPLEACISGWAMLNRRPAVIEDIYADERIPHDAYRPTFVKSLVMVPIRTVDPLGAIGMYWDRRHLAGEQEVAAARALADSTAVALEHIQALRRLERASHLSETDPLTGLPNRRTWDAALAAALSSERAPICVGMIDLDGFKGYNDSHGHPAGDALLRRVGAVWRAMLRGDDLLARHGGDEFAVLMPGCGAERALLVGDRLRRALPHGLGASIGVAEWDGAEPSPSLMGRADAALYEAKRSGRDGVRLAA